MLTRRQTRSQTLQKPANGSKNGVSNIPISKRAAENSPATQQPQKKRSALGDITNDLRNVRIDSSKKQALAKAAEAAAAAIAAPEKPGKVIAEASFSVAVTANSVTVQEHASISIAASGSDVSMLSTVEESAGEQSIEQDLSIEEGKSLTVFPPGFGIRTDYDRENEFDPYNVPHYAQDIFDYYRARETRFLVKDYMDMQQGSGGITRQMRAILIDWMVEVQESFELNHETLYQAVKMTDLYLEKVAVDKETLQLVGATALFISSKFDERQPPLIDDFLYICDDAYSREQIFDMEHLLLKTLKFDIGYPLSYRFLRRYAKATKVDMTTLTLSRYILEMSLMHYDFVRMPESLVAAASLLLAFRMRGETDWTDIHVQYSGYTIKDLEQIMWDLNTVIKGTPMTKSLNNIRLKYSHDIFFGVAKMSPLSGPLVSPIMSS